MEQNMNQMLEDLKEELEAMGGKLLGVTAILEQGEAHLEAVVDRLTAPKASRIRTIDEEQISDLITAARLIEAAVDLQESYTETLAALLACFGTEQEGETD